MGLTVTGLVSQDNQLSTARPIAYATAVLTKASKVKMQAPTVVLPPAARNLTVHVEGFAKSARILIEDLERPINPKMSSNT